MRYYGTVILILTLATAHGQIPDSILFKGDKELRQKRLPWFAAGTSVGYGVTLFALSKAWYSDQERTDFHFFADQKQWKQVDKVGHFFGGFQLSHLAARGLRWSGIGEKKAYIWGSVMGWAMMLPIEILDGYSSEYGASWSDLVANTAGTGFLIGQYALWQEIRIHPKYSFSRSDYAALRPELLGDGLAEEMLKDYNGQTYWLSFDIYSLIGNGNKFPKWLNLAVGYGADAMVYASEEENNAAGYEAYRQYYLSIDIDLTHIKTNKKWVKTIIYCINTIHLPAPALEFNRIDGVRFRPFFF